MWDCLALLLSFFAQWSFFFRGLQCYDGFKGGLKQAMGYAIQPSLCSLDYTLWECYQVTVQGPAHQAGHVAEASRGHMKDERRACTYKA